VEAEQPDTQAMEVMQGRLELADQAEGAITVMALAAAVLACSVKAQAAQLGQQ